MAESNANQLGAALPVGAKIGKYEVRQTLAAGGGAIVYKCYDAMLGRLVTIKQIPSQLAFEAAFLDRFRREAQILARLGAEQPAIIAIHELVEDARGLFVVMEHVDGQTLETILATSPVPAEPKGALQVIWRLAAGLNAAHGAGIIHRDIKPANIIVAEGLKVKIADFGVAASSSWQTSILLGTTKYMAPELLAGGAVDGRVDIYSLGMIAYEMLAGRGKFNEVFADVLADRAGEAQRWMKWHGNHELAAPPLHEINPAVPPPLAAIVARMMDKDRSRRFASMEELGRAIRQTFSPAARAKAAAGAAADEAEQLQLPGEGQPDEPLAKRSLSLKTKIIMAVICLAVAVTVGIVVGVRAHREQMQRRELVRSIYDGAIAAYEAGNYDSAIAALQDLQGSFAQPPAEQAIKASVMLHMAQARAALAAGDWDAAQAAENAAREQARQVQAAHVALASWTQGVVAQIDAFSHERDNTRLFVEAMVKARAAAEDGQLAEARDIVERNLRDVQATPAQQAERTALLEELAQQELAGAVEDQLAAADEALEAGKFADARSALAEAQAALASPEAALLPASWKKDLADQLRIASRRAEAEQAYAAAVADVERARALEDMAAELAALERAIKAKPLPADQDRARRLKSEMAVARGRELVAEAKWDEAREEFEQAAKIDPGNPEAAAEIDRLAATIEWTDVVEAARAAEAAGNMNEALSRYRQAAGLRSDDEVDEKIIALRFAIQLAEGDALAAARKYDEASDAYEAARQIMPGEAAVVSARKADLRMSQEYEQAIARGDAALAQQRWGEAIRQYRNAKGIRGTAEADERIANGRYQENLFRGTEAIEAKDYRAARGYLRIAKGFKDTAEVNALIASCEAKLEESQE